MRNRMGSSLNLDTTVVGLQGHPISSTGPTSGQALVFDGTDWVPTTVQTGGGGASVGPNPPASPGDGDLWFDDSTGTLNVWNGSAWVPAYSSIAAATQNYVDNSGFTINQRAYLSGTALAANAYGFDRWKAGDNGCTLNFTDTPASTMVTIGTGSLIQIIEGIELLSAVYMLSWAGTAVCSVNGEVTVPSPIIVNAMAGDDLSLAFQGGTLGQVKLELGWVVTPWEPIPFQIEITRCQRFFQTYGYPIFSGYADTAGSGFFTFTSFTTFMRDNPTIIPIDPTFSNAEGLYVLTVTSTGVTWQSVAAAPGPSWAQFGFTASSDL